MPRRAIVVLSSGENSVPAQTRCISTNRGCLSVSAKSLTIPVRFLYQILLPTQRKNGVFGSKPAFMISVSASFSFIGEKPITGFEMVHVSRSARGARRFRSVRVLSETQHTDLILPREDNIHL